MDTLEAISALGALAHETRLKVFRLLVGAGEDGMPAGEIARRLGVPHNTMSTCLGILAHAGLVWAERCGRQMIYRLDREGTRRLLSFLLEDCCAGRPELCGVVFASATAADARGGAASAKRIQQAGHRARRG